MREKKSSVYYWKGRFVAVSGLKTHLSLINWTFFPRIQILIFHCEATQYDHIRSLYDFGRDKKNLGVLGVVDMRQLLLKRTMCCCCSACGRSLLSETQRGSTTLLITHENVLYLGLLQYHWQLVMMKKVDHGMLKEEIKLSKNAQPMYIRVSTICKILDYQKAVQTT